MGLQRPKKLSESYFFCVSVWLVGTLHKLTGSVLRKWKSFERPVTLPSNTRNYSGLPIQNDNIFIQLFCPSITLIVIEKKVKLNYKSFVYACQIQFSWKRQVLTFLLKMSNASKVLNPETNVQVLHISYACV
jgi:hypothetical protein